MGNGAFLGIKDAKENGSHGGKKSAEKKAGFLNPDNDKHGSKYVKGTKWWRNNSGDRVRSDVSPGDDWILGMGESSNPNISGKHTKDTFWWISDDGERKRSKESPGEGWKMGYGNRKRK